MGMFGAALKSGLAKKALEEARKPQNQQKLKELAANVAARRKGGTGGGTPGGPVR